MTEMTEQPETPNNVVRLQDHIDKMLPEAEALPNDPAFRVAVLEEGFALLLKEAGKVMHALRHEHQMRESKPNGPRGEGWEHAFGRLAGEEAGILLIQARGLVKLGSDKDLQKHLRTNHIRLVNNWKAMIDPLKGAFEGRLDPEGLDERTEEWIEKCLKTMKRSYNLFNTIARNRARRVGPKRAALLRFNAEQVRRKVHEQQRALMQAAIAGGADVGQEAAAQAEQEAGSGKPQEAGEGEG